MAGNMAERSRPYPLHYSIFLLDGVKLNFLSVGSGDLPFTGGNLIGEIATFQFSNFALDASSVLENYADMFVSPGTGISKVAFDTSVAAQRPASVAHGAFESDLIQVFHERTDILDSNLEVDIDGFTAGVYDGTTTNLPNGTIEAGTEFSSYLVHLDPTGAPTEELGFQGTIRFDRTILGILVGETSLNASDVLLSSVGEYATVDRSLDLNTDRLALFPDARTLFLDLNLLADRVIDLRVITATAEGLPGDFNLDDIISTSDLQVWESAFDSTDLGDAHFDGNTDGIDFLIYQENFQLVNGALGGTVPEPATISFVTFLFGVFLAGQRSAPARTTAY